MRISPRNPLRTPVVALAAGLALTLAACGDDPTEAAAAPAAIDGSAEAAPATTAVDVPVAIDVLAGETDLGPVLVGPDGRTLYGFTNDVDALSTCYGTCADAWPPVIVTDDWTAGPGLDFGIFATTVREDGQRQLVAGRWPLYYFAGDAAPGDINGQGSGDVWFAVDLGGGLIPAGETAAPAAGDTGDSAASAPAAGDDSQAGADSGGSAYGAPAGQDDGNAAAPPPVATVSTDIGQVLADEAGRTLYGFLDDRGSDGSTCNGPCADAWPPVIVNGSGLPAGLDPEVFSVVTRDDGTNQLAAGIWPLYRFAGDAAQGDINGQGSGDVWFAVNPTGGLVGAP